MLIDHPRGEEVARDALLDADHRGVHLGARLWTRNVRHFPMFAGLEAPY